MKLYRGTKTKKEDGTLKNRYLETPREPTDTNVEIHQLADSWFHNKFGIKARSQTIFVSTCQKQASIYSGEHGVIFEVEPVGDYNLIYSANVDDFLDHTFDGICGSDAHEIIDWLENKSYCCVDSISSLPEDFKGEVMIYCKEYSVKALPDI